MSILLYFLILSFSLPVIFPLFSLFLSVSILLVQLSEPKTLTLRAIWLNFG